MLVAAVPAQATVMGVFPGDLIKLKDDKNPATTEDKVVYYFDKEWQRRPFPNQKVFESWYQNFDTVKEITKEEMAEIRLGAPIVYRPGTRLIKVPSIPKVYAVEPDGVLRWIETEAVAKTLYGNDWAKRVDDVPDAYFINYKEGAPLTAPVWPTGTVLKRSSDGALYLVEGLLKRRVTPTIATSLRLQNAHAISVDDAALSALGDRGDVTAWEPQVVDTAQRSFIDTPSPPAIDFPARIGDLERGKEQSLGVFRISSGLPVIIRQLRVNLSGALAGLKDLKFVDINGNNLFGTTQLVNAGGPETLAINGAYTMPANAATLIELRATVPADATVGGTITVAWDRSGFTLADGTNGNILPDFYPRGTLPSATLKIK
jgi:hypothetical protein